ncbi:MAG: hypothetical protein KC656_06655 [Myxococcales bacterium]|nr:hypothetical protein [Myxococcales bacterium]MCB9668707.1 hypothetical protein [Alphaproteobacteria bacterium]MCB9691504.1 hypothetical protein [Alphaproteobacteria bacterium]
MTEAEWIALFERQKRHLIDPRRCTVAPDGDGGSLYAALYDGRDFESFEEFEAWIAWTTKIQPSLITDGPSLGRVEWSGPSTLKLPYDALTPGPTLRHAIKALCTAPELDWVRALAPVNGRLRTADSLDAHVLDGWLTLFRLPGEEEEPLTWYRVDLPDPAWREHLVSDLAVRLRVELAGLGHFDSTCDDHGCRIWFKASPLLQDALDDGKAVIGSPLQTTIASSLLDGEAVYLTRLGLLEVDRVVDARSGEPRTVHVVSFQADTELLLDLDEAVRANTLPPR